MNEFIAFTQELSDASGKIIRKYFRTFLAVDQKTDQTPVTIADKEAEAAMRRLIQEEIPEVWNHRRGIRNCKPGPNINGCSTPSTEPRTS